MTVNKHLPNSWHSCLYLHKAYIATVAPGSISFKTKHFYQLTPNPNPAKPSLSFPVTESKWEPASCQHWSGTQSPYMTHRALHSAHHSAHAQSKLLMDSGVEGNQKGTIIEGREHANEMYNYADQRLKIILTNWKLKLMSVIAYVIVYVCWQRFASHLAEIWMSSSSEVKAPQAQVWHWFGKRIASTHGIFSWINSTIYDNSISSPSHLLTPVYARLSEKVKVNSWIWVLPIGYPAL